MLDLGSNHLAGEDQGLLGFAQKLLQAVDGVGAHQGAPPESSPVHHTDAQGRVQKLILRQLLGREARVKRGVLPGLNPTAGTLLTSLGTGAKQARFPSSLCPCLVILSLQVTPAVDQKSGALPSKPGNK